VLRNDWITGTKEDRPRESAVRVRFVDGMLVNVSRSVGSERSEHHYIGGISTHVCDEAFARGVPGSGGRMGI